VRKLRKAGAKIMTGCTVIAIEAGQVVYENENGSTHQMAADRVALAVGWRPRGAKLGSALGARELVIVGDAEQPDDFVAAVGAGAEAALRI
jgi:pyruvate/2-oxoglutarate dehydrogenase complex dihydrolipoamide dehydrogenase (E3) component